MLHRYLNLSFTVLSFNLHTSTTRNLYVLLNFLIFMFVLLAPVFFDSHLLVVLRFGPVSMPFTCTGKILPYWSGFGATSAAFFVLISRLRKFLLSAVTNRFELRCQLHQLFLLYDKISPCFRVVQMLQYGFIFSLGQICFADKSDLVAYLQRMLGNNGSLNCFVGAKICTLSLVSR